MYSEVQRKNSWWLFFCVSFGCVVANWSSGGLLVHVGKMDDQDQVAALWRFSEVKTVLYLSYIYI